jgi:DNA-binding CsgD family transcriptional regulator
MDALVATHGRRSALTPRERQIVEMLALGATGEQIAQQLVLSPETVQKHVHNAKRKVGAATRAHLIALALTRGLIDPPREPASRV